MIELKYAIIYFDATSCQYSHTFVGFFVDWTENDGYMNWWRFAICINALCANVASMASSSENKKEKLTRIEREIQYHFHALERLSNLDPVTKYARPSPSKATTINYNLPTNIADDMIEQFEGAAGKMLVLRQEIQLIALICGNIHGSINHWMQAIKDVN